MNRMNAQATLGARLGLAALLIMLLGLLSGTSARALQAADEPAQFTVLVPEEAVVTFDGEQTTTKGKERSFLTPCTSTRASCLR